jgi:hypothetical protein
MSQSPVTSRRRLAVPNCAVSAGGIRRLGLFVTGSLMWVVEPQGLPVIHRLLLGFPLRQPIPRVLGPQAGSPWLGLWSPPVARRGIRIAHLARNPRTRVRTSSHVSSQSWGAGETIRPAPAGTGIWSGATRFGATNPSASHAAPPRFRTSAAWARITPATTRSRTGSTPGGSRDGPLEWLVERREVVRGLRVAGLATARSIGVRSPPL